MWVMRTSLTGEVTRTINIDNDGDEEGRAIAAMGDGGCVVAGWSQRVGEGRLPLVVRLNSMGEEVWRTPVIGSGIGQVNGLDVCADGTILVAGSVSELQPYQEMLLARLSPDA